MSFEYRIPVRFPDVDFARVLYFPRFFDYCHRTFEEFFPAEVGLSYAELIEKRNLGFPTVHAEADFRAPLRFGEVCRVRLEVTKLGGRSLTCRYRLFGGDGAEPRAQIELVTVAIEMGGFRSADIPDDIRAALARHVTEAG